MGRRLFTALILAGLAAAAWWIARADDASPEGLVVHVEVVDAKGTPVAVAQIERVFENKRLRVDSQGRARLTAVVLRELDAPSPESLARAIHVHAPYHALRHERDLEIAQRADGSWSMRVPLAAHGVLRLYVDETHLGPCKALLELSTSERPFEPIGGRHVARHGSPASYRIFDAPRTMIGDDELVIRIEGEADRDGAISVATRKLRVPSPAPGHVVEQVLKPEEVQVILGQVNVKDGPKPPSLGGHVTIWEVGEDAERIPLARVKVPADGRFLARRTGKGRYELEFELDFFPGTTKLTVLGGATFDVEPAQPAAWVTLKHPGTDLSKRRAYVEVWASGEKRDAAGGFLQGDGVSQLALPGAGSYRIEIGVRGTNALAPLKAEVALDIVSGSAELEAPFREIPHGTVVVRIAKDVFGKARGATVHVHDWRTHRTATLIPGLAESVTFKRVRASNLEVDVEWDEEGREDSSLPVAVEPGKTVTVDIEDDRP